jgi:hypothetical protein
MLLHPHHHLLQTLHMHWRLPRSSALSLLPRLLQQQHFLSRYASCGCAGLVLGMLLQLQPPRKLYY